VIKPLLPGFHGQCDLNWVGLIEQGDITNLRNLGHFRAARIRGAVSIGNTRVIEPLFLGFHGQCNLNWVGLIGQGDITNLSSLENFRAARIANSHEYNFL